jgi:hypothetical protein
MTDADPYLHEAAHEMHKAIADFEEAYLLRFFGSKEQAELAAPYFEIEEYPVEIDMSQDANLVTLSMKSQFRLKLKENFKFTDIPIIKENDEEVR